MADSRGGREREAMEIAIVGEGEAVIRYIDRHGQTLLQERLVVSGPPGVTVLRHMPLSIATVRGPAALAPVITSVSPDQHVTFDGEDPVRFVRRRCQAIGCRASVGRDAARGVAPAPTPRGDRAVPAEPEMTDVLRAAAAPRRRTRKRAPRTSGRVRVG